MENTIIKNSQVIQRKAENEQKKEQNETERKKQQHVYLSPTISIILLNVNGFKTPMKKQQLLDWI